MTPPIPSQFFTAPEVAAIAEFLRSPVGQRYAQFRLLSRPPINPGHSNAETVALTASLAEGWEACVELDEQFTRPAAEKPERPAFTDMSSDLPGHETN